MDTSWEALFAPNIIAKAEKLLESNSDIFNTIKINAQAAGDLITCTVNDQRKYQVKIKLAADPAHYQMSCNCRDGLKGKKCRHMAVALMAWHLMQQMTAPGEAERASEARTVAETASLESIRAFLLRLFTSSSEAFDMFKAQFPEEVVGASETASFERELDQIISQYQLADGRIKVSRLEDLEEALADALDEGVEFLSAQLDWESAWELILYAFKRGGELQVADRGAHYSQASVRSILMMILDKGEEVLLDAAPDPDFEAFAFRALHQLIAGGELTPDNLEMALEFYCDQFTDRQWQLQQVKLLQQQYQAALAVYRQNGDEDQFAPWVSALLRVLMALDRGSQVAKLLAQHGDLFAVRLLQLETRFNAGDGGWDEVKPVIEQLKDEYKHDAGKTDQLWRVSFEMMMAAAEREFEAQQQTLADFVAKWQKFGNPEKYLKMKERLAADQWPAYKQDYLAALKGRPEALENLRQEGDLATLLAQLQEADAYAYWHRYRDLFAADHPDLYLNAYEAEVRDKLRSSSQGRPYYRKVAQIVAAMYELEGGAKRADSLITELTALYAKRPALVDELAKVRRE